MSSNSNANVVQNPVRIYFPGNCALLYLIASFVGVLFVDVGDNFRVQNPATLTAFVVAAFACFYIGYISRTRSLVNRYRPRVLEQRSLRVMQGLLILASCHLIVDSLLLMFTFGASGVSLSDLGNLYQRRLEITKEMQESGENSVFRQLTTVTYALQAFCVPLGILLWSRMRSWVRVIFLVAVAVYCLYYVSVGTNVGIGNIVVFSASALAVRYYGNWPRQNGQSRPATLLGFRQGGKAGRRRLVAGVALLMLLFVGWFGYNMHSRDKAYGLDVSRFNGTLLGRVIGSHGAELVSHVVGYTSHAYVGLSYDLQMPFEWTCGIGNSRAAMSYALQYFGIDVLPRHYMYRTQEQVGWSMDVSWSTVFPWIASDVTFVGCLVVMFVVGRLFARTWFEATVECRLSSTVVFCQLCLFVMFVPMNNQLVQARGSLWSTVVLALYWSVDHLLQAISSRR